MSEHTKGPWHIGLRTAHSKRDIYGTRGELIAVADACFTDLATAQANAAFIVRACNSHEALVKDNAALTGQLMAVYNYLHARNLGEPAKQLEADIRATVANATTHREG